jgi:VanZ family protein
MGMIYFLSSRPDLPHIQKVWLEMLLRKLAHFAEYVVLGALLTRAAGLKGLRGVALGAVLGALYAASDEWHQTFVPGRKGNLWDVLLDSTAALVGAYLWLRLRTHALSHRKDT